MRGKAYYMQPGRFITWLVFGTLTSVLIGYARSKKKSEEVTTMYPQETTHLVGQKPRWWMEEEGSNPLMIYERDLPYWAGESQVPVEIVGASVAELAQSLNTMEASLNDGGKAKVELLTDTIPSDADLDNLYSSMIAMGFHTTKPTAKVVDGIPSTEMVLRKGSPVWALLIPLIPTLMIGGLIAFGVTRIESISKALVPILLVVFGGVVMTIALITRKAPMETAQRALGGRSGLKSLTKTIPAESKKALAVR